MLIRIEAPHAVFGLEVKGKKEITRAPPIAKWTIGKDMNRVIDYYKKKNYKVEILRNESYA